MDTLIHDLTRPDHLPVVLLLPGAVVLLVLWWRAARKNDRLLEQGGEAAVLEEMEGPRPADAAPGQRIHTWPYLVRVELLAALGVLLILIVWSIRIDAPLEQLADPSTTPNPSKAPWYFVGLQELLVYFDPWIAGVIVPLLAILGLAAIPYLDPNPRGNGYLCWRDRRFAIATFLGGFFLLWLLPITVGVLCRGPGWHWYWPWQPWNEQLVEQPATRNWSDLFAIPSGTAASIFGGVTVLGYYGLAVLYWFRRRGRPTLVAMGRLRYAITAFLFLTMLAIPIKIALHALFSIHYVWVTPWFNV